MTAIPADGDERVKIYMNYMHTINSLHMDVSNASAYELDPTNYLNASWPRKNDAQRKIMEKFFDNTQHVSYTEFRDSLYRSFDAFLNSLNNTTYVIVLHTKPAKSNYWVALLFLDYVENNNRQRPSDILEQNEIYGGDIVCVMFDDVCYSGTQMVKYMLNLYSPTPDTVDADMTATSAPARAIYNALYYSKRLAVCVGYMSDIALKKIKVECENVQLHVGATFSKSCSQIITNSDNVMFENMNDQACAESTQMIYFDHKIADRISSFPNVYKAGRLPNLSIRDATVSDLKPVIKACASASGAQTDELFQAFKKAIVKFDWDAVPNSTACIPPYYKTLNLIKPLAITGGGRRSTSVRLMYNGKRVERCVNTTDKKTWIRLNNEKIMLSSLKGKYKYVT